MENILSTYYCKKDTSEMYPLNEVVSIVVNNNLGEIRYTFPSTKEEFIHIDHLWFYPTILSLF